jgi:hypothetical protein
MKRLYISFFIIIACVFNSSNVSAQAVTCDPNINFNLGTFANWLYFYGDYSGNGLTGATTSCTPNTNPFDASNSHWFQVTASGNDPYGNFPVVDPLHSHSLKLGKDVNNLKAEKATYFIHVPAGVNDYALYYRFAVVFEDPASPHTYNEKPRFMITTTDSITGNPVSCGNITYVAGSNMPGFINSATTSAVGNGTDVWYRPWSLAALNLSGLAGKTIKVEFEADDCSLGGHFGYAYLDVDCGRWSIQQLACNYNSTTTLAAPPGDSAYVWFDAAYTASFATGDTIQLNTPAATTIYHAVCVPYNGYGCRDTLTTTVVISPLALTKHNDTTICNGSTFAMNAAGTGTATPLAYSWSPNTNLSCANCNTPNASPLTTTKYYITVSDSNGCGITDSVSVTVNNAPVIGTNPADLTACENTTVTFTAAATASPAPTLNWQVSTNGGATYNNLGVTSNTLSFNCNQSHNGNKYRVAVSNGNTCGTVYSTAATLTVNTIPLITTNIFGNVGFCTGSNISLTTAASGTPAPTVQWQQSSNGGVTYTNIPGATSNTFTTPALIGLNNYNYQAVYSNVCATTISNPVTVSINAAVTPTISIVSNLASPICAGTNVIFTANATNGGANPTYQWKKNGFNVGTNSNTYSDNTLNTGDAITCVYTTNALCATQPTATSNAISFTVNPAAPQQGAFNHSSPITYHGQIGVPYDVTNIVGATFNWTYSGTGITINGSGNSVTTDFSQTSTSGNLCVYTSNAFGCNSTPTCVAINVKPYITWTSGHNTDDWHDGANWDCGFEPYGTISCYIPAGTAHDPHCDHSDGNCYNLILDHNATLTIHNTYKIHCNNDFNNNGQVFGPGTLHHRGSSCHMVYGRGRVDHYELDNSCGATINAGDTLHIVKTYLPTLGVMTCTGELELCSDASGTAGILNPPGACTNYINGNVICDRFIPGGRRAFRFFGHPFSTSIALSQLEQYIDITGQGGASNGFTPTVTNNPSAFWYNTLTGNGSSLDDATGWIPFTNCDGNGPNAWNPFEGTRALVRGTPGQGLGCNVCVPNDVTIKLRGPVHQCDVSTACQTNANVGYNFISNPYPCDIDLSLSSREASIGSTFSVWDPHQGTIGAYVTQPFTFSYILPSLSSFFVTCGGATNNHISFHETDKTAAAPTDHLFKTTSGFGSNVLQLRILSNNDSLSWDRLLLFFNNQANSATDHLDGLKIMNPDLSFYAFSTDNNTLSVDSRPYVPTQVIPLGLVNAPQNAYAIRVDDYSIPGNGYVYLHDKYLNQIQLLSANAHYDFSVTSDTASQGNNRFELNFTNTPLDVNSLAGTSVFNAQIMPNPATSMVSVVFTAPQAANTTLRITNLLGQEMYSNDLGVQQQGKVNIPVATFANGIYIVSIHCGAEHKNIRFVKQ